LMPAALAAVAAAATTATRADTTSASCPAGW
jgi:hypothetical protein